MIKRDKYYNFTTSTFENLIEIAKHIYSSDSDIIEDIPDLNEESKKKVSTIFQLLEHKSYGVELYPTLEMKASYIFYSFIKTHPLVNGNKRMAVLTSTTFISMNLILIYKEDNGIEGMIDEYIYQPYLYNLALNVESTNPGDYKSVLNDLEKEFEKFISKISVKPIR